MYLNLDKDYNPFQEPYANECRYGSLLGHHQFAFPGGEQHVRVATDNWGDTTYVSHRLRTSDDIFRLAAATYALAELNTKVKVFIPYLPYARQDRVMVPGDPFSMLILLRFLASLPVDNYMVYDPHSEVSTAVAKALMDTRWQVKSNLDFVRFVVDHVKQQLGAGNKLQIVAPDSGAAKKLRELLSKLLTTHSNAPSFDVISAEKKRNLATGAIEDYIVHGDPEDRDCLIIDDICDGGRTFVELAQKLRTKNARSVHLAVSFGIFSHEKVNNNPACYDKLFTGENGKPLIDTIYCTDGFQDPIKHDRVHTYHLTYDPLYQRH